MHVIRTLEELRRCSRDLGRSEGLGGVLVPTMGALHDGHAALMHQATGLSRSTGAAPGCVATIFVNPTQFNDPRDFDRYPRTLDADLDVCRRAGAWGVFAPSREDVYPAGAPPEVPPLPAVATAPGLEDAHRPGHFAGVCQVVLRLFRLIQPAAAIFGEKDWQQLQVIRAMARGAAPQVQIENGVTVRAPDGLALSSRNALLSAQDRVQALALSRALNAARRCNDPRAAEAAMAGVLADAGIEAEYAVVRNAESLLPITGPGDEAGRALIAARVGGVRLIDNTEWPA